MTIFAFDFIKPTVKRTLWSGALFVMLFAHSHANENTNANATNLQQDAQAWLTRLIAQQYPDATADVQIGRLDSRLKLSPCRVLSFSLPSGARPWSNGSLAAKCEAPQPWQLYLTYQVSLTGPALTLKTPVASRHPLNIEDFNLTQIHYEEDPGSYLLALPNNATARRPMKTGQPLQAKDLLLPDLIQAGAKVWVRVNGSGYSVGQEGKALNSAKAGDTVRVKMSNGRLVRGTATQSGEVEISP